MTWLNVPVTFAAELPVRVPDFVTEYSVQASGAHRFYRYKKAPARARSLNSQGGSR